MRRYQQALVACFAILFAFAAAGGPDGRPEESPSQSITLAELRDHMFYLASDELEGRMTGEEGYRIAARYCVTQFRAAGLQPIWTNDEDVAGFLQPVPLVRSRTGEGNSLTLVRGDEETVFEIGERYLLPEAGDPEGLQAIEAELLFVGYGIHEPEHGWDDYDGLEVESRVVVFLLGAPRRDGEPVLPGELHAGYAHTMRGSVRKAAAAAELGAAAVAIVPNMDIAFGWNMIRNFLGRDRISYAGEEGGGAESPIPILLLHPMLVNELFDGTDFNPMRFQQSGDLEEYRRFELDGVRLRLAVDVVRTEFCEQNVVAMVPGTDPELADQYITVGAHLDHVGMRGDQVMNGADDNASGSVAILEAAEAVAMAPPRRPVIFILYAAEEVGLFGSRYFADHPPVPIGEVMVNINLDMVGRTDPRLEETGGIFAIGSTKLCMELHDAVVAANERVGLPLDFSLDENDPQNYFGRSDHYNFHRHGVPTVFFSSGEHADYHQPSDDADRIEYAKLQQVSRLVYELVMALGDREEPLCADRER